MKVLITGSCNCADPQAVYKRLALLPKDTTIIHGCAVGVDTFAGKSAEILGLDVEEFPPLEEDGPKADQARNIRMTEQEGVTLCIAFWNGRSHGTFHTMYNALIRGIPIEVVMVKSASRRGRGRTRARA